MQSDFERDIAGRIEKVESALFALSEKVDRLGSPRPVVGETRPAGAAVRHQAQAGPAIPTMTRPRPAPRPPRTQSEPVQERGVDWWLARAGVGLTVFAVILLYQYAVGHGWITPTVRVLIGASIGGALMYYGRRMAPPTSEDSLPASLRELMMGAAIAAWYITAFAASSMYHLIPLAASRYLFLLLSIVGGTLSLKERRSGLALIAVAAGFLGPIILSGGAASAPAYAFYLTVLCAMSIILYLMRGWQSVLWISFFGAVFALSGQIFYSQGIVLTVLGLALAIAYGRAPTLRRGLLATGSDRYTEPVRSLLATNWLRDTGRFFKLFSPAAGALDSLSVWVITLAAPMMGLMFLSRAWPMVSDAVWGALALLLALVAYRMCASSSDENSEITHIEGVASLVWSALGAIAVAQALVAPSIVDHGTITLAVMSIAAIAAVVIPAPPGFIATVAVGRLLAGLSVLGVLSREAAFTNSPRTNPDRISAGLSIVELIAIASGAMAWRDMRRREIGSYARDALILMSYGALLLVDARVLGEIWRPLVTASFAIAGTAILFMSRKEESKMLRAVGGVTLALVMFRLFFVDMNGVDTIWRVILFLGIGALFLFTSRQLQVGKPVASGST